MSNATSSNHIAVRQHYAAALGAVACLIVQLPFLPAIVPFLVLILSRTDTFARKHAFQAIKFQVFVLGYAFIACMVVGMLTSTPPLLHQPGTALVLLYSGLGNPMLAIPMVPLFLLGILMPFLAAQKASEGKEFVYPLTFPLGISAMLPSEAKCHST